MGGAMRWVVLIHVLSALWIAVSAFGGAVVRAADVPIHPDVARLPRNARSPLEHALHDGEDYELLFTIPAAAVNDLPILAHVIGAIQSEPGLRLEHPGGRRYALEAKGWEHGL